MGEPHAATTGYTLPTYAFRVPPEIERGTVGRYPIVIVGAGLAGLAAACDLANRGVNVVVLDEDDTIGVRGASSRGIVYAQKTLELFARLGLYDRVRAKGVLWSKGKTLAGNDVVYEFDAATATISLQPPYINLQQFYIEWFLVDRIGEIVDAQGTPYADLRWKNRVASIEDQGEHVRLQVETPAGRYAIDAQWVIDASGLHSLIRDELGVQKDDAGRTPDRWCITDVRFEKPLPIERWTWVEAPFNENRAVWQHLMADDVWRMDFQMAPDSDPEAVSRPEVAAERIRAQIGPDVAFELVWVGPYAYRSYIIETFRRDRVFFIGDAAHVMSPFGARGGNSSIQDADNLAWKLALVVNGSVSGAAAEALLDSFDDERHEAAEVNVSVTRRTARFLAPRTPVEHAIRRAAVGLARAYPFARALVNTGRLPVANVYTRSATLDYASASAGHSVQNVLVEDGDGRARGFAEIMHAFGTRFVALWFPADGATVPASTLVALQALDHREPLFTFAVCLNVSNVAAAPHDRAYTRLTDTGLLAKAIAAQPGSIVLVRPDLYVAGAIKECDVVALEALLARACGRAPERTNNPKLSHAN